jgi:hypothetical protein
LQFDVNKDGRISYEELEAMRKSIAEAMGEAVADKLVEEVGPMQQLSELSCVFDVFGPFDNLRSRQWTWTVTAKSTWLSVSYFYCHCETV